MKDNYYYFLQLAKKYPSKPYVPTHNVTQPNPTVAPEILNVSPEPTQPAKGKGSWTPLVVVIFGTFIILGAVEYWKHLQEKKKADNK